MNDLAGDIAGVIAKQERRDGGELRDPAVAPLGDAGDAFGNLVAYRAPTPRYVAPKVEDHLPQINTPDVPLRSGTTGV